MLGYIAAKVDRTDLAPTTPRERADVDRWLAWHNAHFGPAVGKVAFQRIVKKLGGLGAPDEAIVNQGNPGDSMFVVGTGGATVVLEPDRRPVATIERGVYFGEMSLLTGEARTATVLARGDTLVLEIDADVFRQIATVSPDAVERIGVAAATRRAELNVVRAAPGAAVADAPATFLGRMRRFLHLS
jgi:CRP-like cAMP-binding protein